jgi:hypothetical protein
MADKPQRVLEGAEGTTLRPERVPVVLVAGGPEELVEAARRVAAGESAQIVVEACGAVSVNTAASSMRPFALIVNQDVFAFDPEEFSALARDVHAELIVLKVSAATSPGFLDQALRPSLRTAFRRFRVENESGPIKK